MQLIGLDSSRYAGQHGIPLDKASTLTSKSFEQLTDDVGDALDVDDADGATQ